MYNEPSPAFCVKLSFQKVKQDFSCHGLFSVLLINKLPIKNVAARFLLFSLLMFFFFFFFFFFWGGGSSISRSQALLKSLRKHVFSANLRWHFKD